MMQREPAHSRGTNTGTIVDRVLRSPGVPLERTTCAFFESRFGHDFSRVRVHHDTESTRAVGAHAYTVGSDIVFGIDRPSQHLIAHELAHTVQQSGLPTTSMGAPESEADAAAHAVASGTRPQLRTGAAPHLARGLDPGIPSQQQQPPLGGFGGLLAPPPAQPAPQPTTFRQLHGAGGPHGTNPSTCIAPICTSLNSVHPTGEAAVLAQGRRFRREAADCLTRTASGSGARHANAIAQNDISEINGEVDGFDSAITAAETPRSRVIETRGYMENLRGLCARKQREINIEFNFNVVLENTPIRQWGRTDPTEFDQLEAALRAMPRQATWDNLVEVHLRRDRCILTDPNEPMSCISGVGGQTSYSRGQTTATIDVYDEGVRQQPYARSAARGVPGTTQTITHEYGHVTEEQITADVRNDLRDRIVGWKEWPDLWITGASPANPDERRNAMADAGVAEGPAFDTFLAGLLHDQPVQRNGRTWMRQTQQLGGGRASHRFISTNAGAIPMVPEYQYARTGWIDFFAETYSFATTRPEWLHRTLPADQLAWWKDNVFRIPSTRAGWQAELASMQPPLTADEIDRLMQLMTRDQANQTIEAMRDQRRRRQEGMP